MATVQYNTATCSSATDFESYTRRLDLPVFQTCEDLMPQFGECKTCSGDANYCQPIKVGDPLHFQYIQPQQRPTRIEIRNSAGSAVLASDIAFPSGAITGTIPDLEWGALAGHDDGANYYTFMDVTGAYPDCFTVYVEYISTVDGVTTGNVESNPYCIANDCRPTAVVSATYGSGEVDCLGLIHGGGYDDRYRIPAAIEKTGFSFQERIENEDDEIVSQLARTEYELITEPVPEYVADILWNLMSAGTVTVDYELTGTRFKNLKGLEGFQKNNDKDGSWLIRIKMYKDCELDRYKC